MAALAIAKTETGCRPAQWFGEWAVLPEALIGWVSAVQACDLQAVSEASSALRPAPLYALSDDGVATIGISGPISKYGSSFQSLLGGASTLEKRQALRAATRDDKVKAVLMLVDSPGGTVTGVGDLAEAVAQADKVKPVYAYIEDMGASAAYRVAARARKVYANADAQVGSIGTYSVLVDESGAYAKEGVRVEVVSTGEYKGLGVPGTKVGEKERDEAQRRVDALNEQFLSDVSVGRHLPMEKVRKLADGRVHMAQAAMDLGLIDKVASLDEVAADIRRTFMDQAELAQKAEENEQLRQRVEELTAATETATAQLAAIAKDKRLDEVRAKVAGLKNLPALPDLAQALVAIADAAPDAYAVLDRQLAAWNAQVKTAALFEEKGSNQPGAVEVDVDDPKALRAAAQARVDAGQAKDRASAMDAILREQGRK